MNESVDGMQEDPLAACRGIKNGFIASAIIWSLIIGVALMCSGCANVRPIVNADGEGGGVQVSTETNQGSWIAPAIGWGSGGVCLYKVVDALKDKNNTYNYSGTYNEYTAGNDNIVFSQNKENPKRVKAAVEIRRRK